DDIPLDEVSAAYADPQWPPSPTRPGYFLTHCKNTHVPAGSYRAENTRLVRISRAYLSHRSSSPIFLDAYPGFPLALYMSEDEFSDLIAEVNYMLELAFSRRECGNIIDSVLMFATCGLSGMLCKSHCDNKIRELEDLLEVLNKEVYAKRGIRVVSPRRSAFKSFDIEIPFPF
ncbi:Golgin subfamily A member 7/ERF4 family-domain-containing protein, partial [Kockiozyma suomiensis]|uniref:Golgin subfamily A member 7/ERF4 family-domain-containing protein n=1 Tax=Kockiozyma suomiensis TaxID=1337062 RepID=UPI0033430C84